MFFSISLPLLHHVFDEDCLNRSANALSTLIALTRLCFLMLRTMTKEAKLPHWLTLGQEAKQMDICDAKGTSSAFITFFGDGAAELSGG